MKRAQKYPETDFFHYYNANPKNRIAADCVIRAISTALEQSWEQTVRELTEIGLKQGRVLNEKKCYEKYLEEKGWIKHDQPRGLDGTKYTIKQFIQQEIVFGLPRKIIAHCNPRHVVAIMDGKVYDIWNSSNQIIGNYWTKEL